jgi:RHS repeat-associated protein
LLDHKNIVQELQGLDNTAAVKAHLLTAGIDALFLRIEGNEGASLHSMLTDAVGSTVMALDATQQPVANYAYDSYGLTTVDASIGNTQQYAGRENDNPGNVQGLYYYRARYYMPGIGRFISEDPIGWTSGQANNYAYVGGNPIDFRDPFGLSAADNFEDFSAGFGDALTFGLGRLIRSALGIDGVHTCSGWYAGGAVAGVVALTVATAGVGTEAEAGADALEALGDEEAVAEGAAADGAENAPNAVDPNALHHIFGKLAHNLGPLLQSFGGSQEAAFRAIEAAADAAVRAQGITGVFRDIAVSVNGFQLLVRGAVVGGITRLSTAFIP